MAVLDTNDSARRLGEIGIGMNRDIGQFIYNMLFDEKIGDTVHTALGRAYEEIVGEDNERNDNARDIDMIVDGEIVQRAGTFRFEE